MIGASILDPSGRDDARKGEPERCAAVRVVSRGDGAAMRFNDAARDGEPDADAVPLGRDERLEHVTVDRRGETRTPIANRDLDGFGRDLLPHPDPARRP